MKYLSVVAILLLQPVLLSQTDSLDIDTLYGELIEDIETEDNNSLLDQIEYYINNPITLNDCDTDDLLELPFIDQFIAKKIVSYVKQNKTIYNVNELFLIRDIDNITARRIIPFFRISPTEKSSIAFGEHFNNIHLHTRSRIQEKYVSTEKSIPITSSLLNKKVYNRILLSNKYFSAGALIEKDPQENQINDFQTFHLAVYPESIINQVFIGDFNVKFGQGLVIWTPYGFSKGSDAFLPFQRHSRFLSPNTSSNESTFHRGTGISIKYNSMVLSSFYSNVNRDATLNELNEVTSFPLTGYHRTQSEIEKKGNTNQKCLGAMIGLSTSDYNVSLLAYNVKYNRKLIPNSVYDLSGDSFSFYSCSYSVNTELFKFNGELAHNNKSFASINSLQLNITEELKLLFSYRNYPVDFKTLFGNGLGEISGNRNEQGYYIGFKYKLLFFHIDTYFDSFVFPQASSLSIYSTKGNDFLINISTKWINSCQFRIKYKYETKLSLDKAANYNIKKSTSQIKFSFRYKPSSILESKSGIDFVQINNNEVLENGILLYQELRYKPTAYFLISARIILFDTDSYQSRIYHFENDVRGVMNNLPFYKDGNKFYILFSCAPFPWLTLSGKYSTSSKNEKTEPNLLNQYYWYNSETYYSLQVEINL